MICTPTASSSRTRYGPAVWYPLCVSSSNTSEQRTLFYLDGNTPGVKVARLGLAIKIC